MLVFNEVKLYDERRQNYKDFAMLASEQADGKIYPRLLKTNVGDIFTTNTFVSVAGGPDATVTGPSLTVGNKLAINAQGFLAAAEENATGPIFKVVKEYHLADKQPAVKLQRIQ